MVPKLFGRLHPPPRNSGGLPWLRLYTCCVLSEKRALSERFLLDRISGMPKKFYFDFKNGITQRDSHGSSFKLVSEAILYSKTLAQEERMKNPSGHRDLIVSVVNESGAEVHTELVYPR
jgi:hypothetical protein